MFRAFASLVPCPACRKSAAGPTGLCPACLEGLEEPLHLPGIVALGHYEGALKRAVLAVKFSSATRLADALGRALGRAVRASGRKPLAVCFVPLHPSRFRSRGYDQAALLAAGVAGELGIPKLRLLRRHAATRQQAMLGLLARHANAAGRFALAPTAPRILPRRLLLVDDVMTSGATLEACRSELLAGGCEHVLLGVAGLTRTRGRSESEGHAGTESDQAADQHLGVGMPQ